MYKYGISIEYHVYWLLKGSDLDLFGDAKYSLCFDQKRWWIDDFYLAFLNFPWYSRTWETWFFGHCVVEYLQLKWIFFFKFVNNSFLCEYEKISRPKFYRFWIQLKFVFHLGAFALMSPFITNAHAK